MKDFHSSLPSSGAGGITLPAGIRKRPSTSPISPATMRSSGDFTSSRPLRSSSARPSTWSSRVSITEAARRPSTKGPWRMSCTRWIFKGGRGASSTLGGMIFSSLGGLTSATTLRAFTSSESSGSESSSTSSSVMSSSSNSPFSEGSSLSSLSSPWSLSSSSEASTSSSAPDAGLLRSNVSTAIVREWKRPFSTSTISTVSAPSRRATRSNSV